MDGRPNSRNKAAFEVFTAQRKHCRNNTVISNLKHYSGITSLNDFLFKVTPPQLKLVKESCCSVWLFCVLIWF